MALNPHPQSPPAAPPPHDLSDAEFAELDGLLAATPEPLEPLDVVMLDGYLCGILVQPVLLQPDTWLPHVFDFDARPLPESTDADWHARTTALILRRHAAINRNLAEHGWFDPLILEAEDEAAPGDEPVEPGAGDDAAEVAEVREDQPDEDSEGPAASDLSAVAQAVMPWVAGFQHATASFPDLEEMPDDAVTTALARLYRHLPAETDEERELVDTLEREHPLPTLDDALEDLVATVADLYDLTREQRYKVETVRREAPKVGRNDPCPCGSGKKFKQCHGAS